MTRHKTERETSPSPMSERSLRKNYFSLVRGRYRCNLKSILYILSYCHIHLPHIHKTTCCIKHIYFIFMSQSLNLTGMLFLCLTNLYLTFFKRVAVLCDPDQPNSMLAYLVQERADQAALRDRRVEDVVVSIRTDCLSIRKFRI